VIFSGKQAKQHIRLKQILHLKNVKKKFLKFLGYRTTGIEI
jgi:hypothetical protein